ncbi:MAG: ABC transporter permease [Nitrososphaerota archaeon]|nr:ABC transporter permease [Nitrososphaerota archaeon]
MGVYSPIYFFSFDALQNILVYLTTLLILSIGQGVVIMTGNIDLSIIGVAGFAAYIGWYLNVVIGLPVYIVLPIQLAAGAAWGTLNGVIVRKLGVPALVQTLAVMFILYGFLLVVTGGTSLGGFSHDYVWIGTATVGSFRALLLMILPLVCILGSYLIHFSRLGLHILLTGAGADAARLLGIRTDRTVILAFILSGTLAAFGGFITSSRLGIITTYFGRELLMPSIAAPVIGGVSLAGGEGTFIGILFGAFLLQTISTGLVAIGISAWYIDLVNGLIILAAIIIDAVRRKRIRIRE